MSDSFGARLALARTHLRISQAELARRAGYGHATHIVEIEKGRSEPRIGGAASFAEALGVHVDWLINGDAARAPEWLDAEQSETSKPDAA
jgi:transcriptional regulator with XRE-family HTH domain